MNHFFLDTNVVIDVLANRVPFADAGAKLFDYAEKGKVKLYISSLSYTIIYYVIRKNCTHQQMIETLMDVEAITETLDVTKAIVSKSLRSQFKDFEDAVQYHTASTEKKMTAIITRNTKDFKKGS